MLASLSSLFEERFERPLKSEPADVQGVLPMELGGRLSNPDFLRRLRDLAH
jgi:hypothetical protein